jgi:hypothetical protein
MHERHDTDRHFAISANRFEATGVKRVLLSRGTPLIDELRLSQRFEHAVL